jgi:hypothetical protein
MDILFAIAAVVGIAAGIAQVVSVWRRRRAPAFDRVDREHYARRVSAWFERNPEGGLGGTLSVRNGSEATVTNCVGTVDGGVHPMEIVFMTMPPETTLTAQVPANHIYPEVYSHTPWGPSVEVAFTDPEGTNWRRGPDNRLREGPYPARTC